MDIQVEAANLEYGDLEKTGGESSEDIKARVLKAYTIQRNRFSRENKVRSNAQMTAPMVERYCKLGPTEKELIRQAFDRLGLSARAYHKILKMARTIADLEDAKTINAMHLTEALSYRSLDRKYW